MQTFQEITVTSPGSDNAPAKAERRNEPRAADRIAEGDWEAYQLACKQADKILTMDTPEKIEYKRRYATAYLGARAVSNGGVSPKNRPRILSQDFITSLSKQNASKRYAQYPWLQRLVSLMEEIEQIQETVSDSRNIFHLPPSKLQ